jgi:hypothetical protein
MAAKLASKPVHQTNVFRTRSRKAPTDVSVGNGRVGGFGKSDAAMLRNRLEAPSGPI